ncbi:MAG: biopolymer transporter ExbD [Bacteroidales bacterium]|nr:biopolymer transporter ExbD [Bacteroidales bacterium]
MNLRPQNKVKAEIFTSSMNDIMFFLMLFFIIVSTLLSPNVIKLNLPSAKNTQSIHKKEILLSVNKDVQYFVNNKQVPFERLQSALAAEISKDQDSYIVLRCDKTLTVQQLVDVLEIGNNLNVKMILATKKE